MVRPHPPVPSSLRNRNRITNKSRLKIHYGNVDVDPIIPDEDDEKTRLAQRVLGVDQDDANEHHLQQVLSEAAQRTQSSNRRGGDKNTETPAAYIPTPDSTGLVDNYEQLYPPKRGREFFTYVQSSKTVEESCLGGLAQGCTYFMDERDKEWLDKNNEEARGEGTSAQASMTAGTRTSARSAKVKGKEPDNAVAVEMSDDHFELVMGLFELITHEETEYLHHSLSEGMPFPPFSNYQDTFANPLLPTHFATFVVPNGIPPPVQLSRMARCVYPHWKARRIERGGMRIIPQLNGDESDTLNESYICFRRREVKAVRKTRASQANTSERLNALQKQLHEPLQMAKAVLKREALKRESSHFSLNIWQRRVALVDLKRRTPTLGEKGDEELLIEKELPPLKKPDLRTRLPSKAEAGTPVVPQIRTEPALHPSERTSILNTKIEGALQKRKEKDHQWEDVVDNPYTSAFTPYPSRLYKYIPTSTPPSPGPSSDSSAGSSPRSPSRQPRGVRLRRGRGGRMHVDRRDVNRSLPTFSARRHSDDSMDVDLPDPEAEKRLQERWRFDADDSPSVGPGGSEEQDRSLVEDYDSKYLHHTVKLLADLDPHVLTDPTLFKYTLDGRRETVIPFRLGGGVANTMRREVSRPPSQQPMISQAAQQAQAAAAAQQIITNGTPISMQQQIKMPSVGVGQHLRISANGGMRQNGMQSSSPPHSASPTHPNIQFSPSPNGSAPAGRPAITMPHLDSMKMEGSFAVPNGLVPSQQRQDSQQAPEGIINGNYITRPKSQEQNHANYNVAYPVNGHQQANQYMNGSTTGLSLQQMQSLKSILVSQGQDLQAAHINSMRQLPTSYMHSNFNGVKLPNVRQQQWTPSSPMQRPASALNGFDAVNGSHSPHMGQPVPARTPSANGGRRMMPSPHMPQQSPSPMSMNSQSPRPPPTPIMTPAQPIVQGGY